MSQNIDDLNVSRISLIEFTYLLATFSLSLFLVQVQMQHTIFKIVLEKYGSHKYCELCTINHSMCFYKT